MSFCRSIFVYILISVFLCTVEVSAGTLEDIRDKTGWEPAEHSERPTTYCPLITPAELVAYLDKYHRDVIKIQVLFNKITTQGLNKWIGPRRSRHMWSSKKYIAFRIEDPQKQVDGRKIYLFLNKNSSFVEVLLGLTPDVKITIAGFVKDIEQEKAWIEVSNVRLGWEDNES